MLYIKINEDGTAASDTGITEDEIREIAKEQNVSLPKLSGYWSGEPLRAIGYAELYPPRADPNLKQTHDLSFGYIVKQHPTEGVFYRELVLIPVEEEEAQKRWKRKRSDVVEQARKKLFGSDYTQTLDHQLMKKEWAEYRQKLRDIIADKTTDPYLVEFPNIPKIVDTGDELENQKEILLVKLRAKTKERLTGRPRIETGLGFAVDGSTEDLMLFENAQKMGLTELRDADNQMQDIELSDWDEILDAIRIYGYGILKHKWDTEKLIKDASTLEELENIEL